MFSALGAEMDVMLLDDPQGTVKESAHDSFTGFVHCTGLSTYTPHGCVLARSLLSVCVAAAPRARWYRDPKGR